MSRRQANEQDSRQPAPFAHHELRSHAVHTAQGSGAPHQMPLLTSASDPHRAREVHSREPAFDLSLPRVSTITRPDYSPGSTTLPGLQHAHTPHFEDESSRRRKLPRVDSIVPRHPQLPHVTAEVSDSATLHSAQQRLFTLSPSPSTSGPLDQFPRPIITARSPLHKARSFAHLPHLQPPTGTIPADLNPFPNAPSADKYHTEPNTSSVNTQQDHPPRSGYGSPPMISQPPGRPLSRPSPVSSTQSPVFRQHPGSAGSTSPSGSYFSSDQQDRMSPPNPPRPSVTSMPVQLSTYASTPGTTSSGSQIKQEEDKPEGTVPISTSGEGGTYKMMNLDTGTGLLAIPVETGAASRASDEKRKRNAGASARFRERRKQREMESSVTIRKLERQVKDLTEDRDFYMRERDYFSAVLFRQPGAERLPPRPQSPRISRPTPLPIRASELRSFDYDDERSLSPERKPRRSEDSRRPQPDQRHEQLPAMHPNSPLPGTSLAGFWPAPAPVHQQHPNARYLDVHPTNLAHVNATVSGPRADRAEFRLAGGSQPHPAHLHGTPPAVMQAAPTTGPPNPFRVPGRGQNDFGQFGQPRPRHDQR